MLPIDGGPEGNGPIGVLKGMDSATCHLRRAVDNF